MESISTNAAVSDGKQLASGEVAQEVVTNSDQINQVSYETHKRLLGEKKKLQERLEQVESQWNSKKEAELKDQNQWKTLYENEQKERTSLSSKISEQEQRWSNAIKLDSFMSGLGARKIESKYTGFIDLESILLEPETNTVDKLSLQREIDRVCRDYPEIVKGAVQAKQLPGEAPKNPLHANGSLNQMSSKEKLKSAAEFLSKQLNRG